MQPSDPHPLDFPCYRSYLLEWFRRRRGRPSQRAFARDVACSPSLLTHILKGRRTLGPQRARRWSRRLGLGEEEARLFSHMVEVDDHTDPQVRQAAASAVRAARGFRRANARRRAAASLFTQWWVPAIYELSRLAGFQPEPDWVVAQVRPSITLTQAREALDTLTELGLIGAEEAPPMVTPHEVFDGSDGLAKALLQWHRELDAVSRDHLSVVPPTARHAGAVTFAADQATWEAVRDLANAFERQVIDHAQACEQPDRVLQLLVRAFPLAGPDVHKA